MANNITIGILVKENPVKPLYAYKTVKNLLDILEHSRICGTIYVSQKYAKILENITKDKRISFYDGNLSLHDIKTDYILAIKAGNYLSRNWLPEAITLAKTKTASILCPEFELEFGYNHATRIFVQHTDKLQSLQFEQILKGQSILDDTFFCSKKLLESLGETLDVYQLNKSAIKSSIPICSVPGTTVFSRYVVKNASSQHLLEPLDKEFIQQLDELFPSGQEVLTSRTSIKASTVYQKIRHHRIANKIIRTFKRTTAKRLPNAHRTFPKELLKAWAESNSLESSLFPSQNARQTTSLVELSADKELLLAASKLLTTVEPAHYIFFVPWVVRGGGDKVLINYLKAFQQKQPDWKILVVATQASKNEWVSALPANAKFINFDQISSGLSQQDKDLLMCQLIANSNCNNIHIINSGYAFEWVISHAELIKNSHLKINVSSFCYDYIPGTDYQWQVEFADPYIIECYDFMANIFTDNQAIINFDSQKNGFAPSKSIVHYQPVTGKVTPPKNIVKDRPLKLLWASRIAEQKLPTVLRSIGTSLNPDVATIDVYGYFYDKLPKTLFNGIPAITYKGAFNGFQSIDTSKYDAFLYTSIIDGVPNTILEAVSAGLPVIASDSGGISEIIKDASTGYLVKDIFNPSAYIDKISSIKNHPNQATQYAKEAQTLLEKQHSWESYVKKVAKDIIDMIK